MLPQLHLDQVFNMQINQSDAALLQRAINIAQSETDIANMMSPKSYRRLQAMNHQLEEIVTTLVTYSE